ncbi:MAG: dodecin family protein, partial [Pseudolabrys sp.]
EKGFTVQMGGSATLRYAGRAHLRARVSSALIGAPGFLIAEPTCDVRASTSLRLASLFFRRRSKEVEMPDSVYKVITLVGTSTESWEKAAKAAVDRAGKTLRELRVAEVVELDMQLDNGKVEAYRAKVRVSFKFEGKD